MKGAGKIAQNRKVRIRCLRRGGAKSNWLRSAPILAFPRRGGRNRFPVTTCRKKITFQISKCFEAHIISFAKLTFTLTLAWRRQAPSDTRGKALLTLSPPARSFFRFRLCRIPPRRGETYRHVPYRLRGALSNSADR